MIEIKEDEVFVLDTKDSFNFAKIEFDKTMGVFVLRLDEGVSK